MEQKIEKFGIDNIKKVVVFLIKFAKNFTDSFEDPKKTFLSEMIGIISNLIPAYSLIRNASNIKDEIKDLSDDEITELMLFVEAELKNDGFHWIEGQNVQIIVDNAIKMLHSIIDIVEALKQKTNETEN